MRTLHLAETVTTSMFIIGGGSETASLTLENNITLLGHADNGEALVTVATNGTFTMEGNSAIKSNTSDGSGNAPGGGVYVDGGSFTMKDDSLIDNNQAEWSGGGVYVDGGSFDMQGGTISNNMAFSRDGGGVHVNSGTFTMLDGTISGNEAGLYGGGVYVNGAAVNGGVFTKTPMAGPVINGGTGTNPNRASADENGHAVYVENGPYDGYYRDILAASGNEIDTSGGTGLLPP